MNDLRTSLHRVADAADPLPVADDLWQRGMASRRRGQALVVAAVVAIIASVTWSAVLLGTEDREARTASTEVVEGGAIPSTIMDLTDLGPSSEPAVGRASVAFTSDDGQAIVVTARDGEYHAPDLQGWDGNLLVLSPDGTHLSWTIDSDSEGRPSEGFALMDLETGDLRFMSSGAAGSITPVGISWAPSSRWLTWFTDVSVSRTDITSSSTDIARVKGPVEWAAVDDSGAVTYHAADGVRRWTTDRSDVRLDGSDRSDDARLAAPDAAMAAPDGTTVVLSGKTAPDVPFLRAGRYEGRPLATDLYPDGALVRPLGWATDSLVLAQVDGPPGSYVEGPHLALLSAPNVPEDQWTYRIVSRDVPDQPLSIAVDLVPELDGSSSQQLTRDFDRPSTANPLALAESEISWLIGLGVAAAIAVLLALRWLWRRLLG